MQPLVLILIVIGGIVAIALLAAFLRRGRHQRGHDTSVGEIRTELQKIVEGKDPFAWDDFLSFPLTNPRLEAIRQRCLKLNEEFPPASPREYCGPGGIEVIRGYIRELEQEPA